MAEPIVVKLRKIAEDEYALDPAGDIDGVVDLALPNHTRARITFEDGRRMITALSALPEDAQAALKATLPAPVEAMSAVAQPAAGLDDDDDTQEENE